MEQVSITQILQRARQGDRQAVEQVFDVVHGELRAMARAQMRRERPGHTLTPTGLVHEAYLKLMRHPPADMQDRTHFFAIAARAMRQVLIVHAERRATAKRGADYDMVTFDGEGGATACRAEEVLEINRALDALEEIDPQLARIVEYRFYAGLSQEEIATALEVSVSTVARQWRTARAWLRRALKRN